MTEYMRGGDLQFHLQRGFTEDRARFYGAEITLGVHHLHKLGIIHRNISVGIVYVVPQMTQFVLTTAGEPDVG